MDYGVIVTIAVAAIGATWVLRKELGDIKILFHDHAASDAANFKELGGKIIRLEGRSKRR